MCQYYIQEEEEIREFDGKLLNIIASHLQLWRETEVFIWKSVAELEKKNPPQGVIVVARVVSFFLYSRRHLFFSPPFVFRIC